MKVHFSTDQGVARVLDGVNLSIGEGEVVGLAGESGCGKTTLARAILGVLPPSARVAAGRIRFKGEELLEKSSEELNWRYRGSRISLIPQDPYGAFNPVFTVGAQIMELMKWKSPARDKTAPRSRMALLQRYPKDRYAADRDLVLQALRDVQIPQPEQALKKRPHVFSGGQRQRLMIAMAMLPRPDLIIADEPTTALDVTIQAQVLALLRGLVKERGISVLFTTHDLGTAYEICDRIMVMYAGQEMETASTDQFFQRPSHPYTISLLESLPKPGRDIKVIPGEIPGLIDPPPGCRFHPRCRFAQERCAAERPAQQHLDEGHDVRCFNPILTDTRNASGVAELP